MIAQFLDNINFNHWSWLVPWLFGLSVVVFIGSIIGVWFVLIRLPKDYLIHIHSPKSEQSSRSLGQWIRTIVKNAVGIAFIAAGIVMLLTPGQGILAIFVGITLMDFPGKRKLIRKILGYPRVLKAINKLRSRSNKPPLTAVASSANTIRSTP